ncbi:MAG: hypothetical protein INR72_20280 [Williamsia herbipolensis]|nr:hypothetical protein [Williamsia herbipolensis]
MNTIAVAEVERGDILLVTRRPHDAFADLILALDGAPATFTHSGVALGDGTILSSYPFFDGISFPVDLGGLHVDPFAHFWGYNQSIHRLAVDPGERERAAARLDRYSTGPGSFSVPKVVVVAATLHALSPSNALPEHAKARIVRRALQVGEAWDSDGDFYCAEFVTHLYDWRFTLDDLRPPAWIYPVDVPFLARLGVDVVAPVLSAFRTEMQKTTMYAFVDEVRRYDPGFFGPRPFATLRGILDEVGDWLGFETGPRGSLGPVDDSSLDGSTELPSGLVTPRMLQQRCGEDAVAGVEVPPIGEDAA